MEHKNENAESTEIMPVVASPDAIVAEFTGNAPAFYCSFRPSSDAAKAELYNAMNNADVQIGDHIGQIINMRDIIVEPVEIVNDETGEMEKAPRCIIIDTEGHSYTSTSTGIYNALRRLCNVFGSPSWPNGLPVKVRQINTRGGRRVYTLDAVPAAK